MKSLISIGLSLILGLAVAQKSEPYILILGITQDGGFPHIGCKKECCETARANSKNIPVTALALIDSTQKKWWLFEASPDFVQQLDMVRTHTNNKLNYLPEGIFLTHAHIGHYTGLMYLGREALNAKNTNVYVMPKMKIFLSENGPWSQLVSLNNIKLIDQKSEQAINVSPNISITPIQVPHRDEYSETVGYQIKAGAKKYLFIPDIDKWSKWNHDLKKAIMNVDYAFLDATFYSADELGGRDMSEIPHPLVTETMSMFKNSNLSNKIHFIHMNHSNPLLWDEGRQNEIRKDGFNICLVGSSY